MSAERYELNKQLAQMLKGGVIMDVTNAEQAKIAEAAGACAVMALERLQGLLRDLSHKRHASGGHLQCAQVRRAGCHPGL